MTSGDGAATLPALGVDVGGTKVAGGVVAPDGTVLATAAEQTAAEQTAAERPGAAPPPAGTPDGPPVPPAAPVQRIEIA